MIKNILFGTIKDIKDEIDFLQTPPVLSSIKCCAILTSVHWQLPVWVNPVLALPCIRKWEDYRITCERILQYLDAIQSSKAPFTVLIIGDVNTSDNAAAIAKFAKVAKPDIDIRGHTGNLKQANELLFDELMRQWVIKLGEHANASKPNNAGIESTLRSQESGA